MVRAKFECTEKDSAGNVGFMTVYTGSTENEKFFRATPFGTIIMGILNEDAAKEFEVGKQYYVDFTEAN
jgi:hypothetical protein